ncbi:MAG: hypothetical protein KDK75_16560 [Alphaproteobacteria bacterium]|nr:hypothetical protein [Alphaproteobacteria bacterium]
MSDELFENARWLIGAIARALYAREGEGVSDVLERMAEQDLSAEAFAPPAPARVPALRHLSACIGETMLLDSDLAAAIAAVEDSFNWRRTETYTDALLGQGFTDNYGWTEIIGPHGYFPGDDFLLGLLLLGPHLNYRDHYHPAPELYVPLTPGSAWSKDRSAFEIKPAGAIIWHPSMALHATVTAERPMLAVWSWPRDTHTFTKLAET